MEQRAVPFISYQNVGAAADWLSEAFGFNAADLEGHRWMFMQPPS